MTSGRLGLCPHDTEINLNKIWTYFVENLCRFVHFLILMNDNADRIVHFLYGCTAVNRTRVRRNLIRFRTLRKGLKDISVKPTIVNRRRQSTDRNHRPANNASPHKSGNRRSHAALPGQLLKDDLPRCKAVKKNPSNIRMCQFVPVSNQVIRYRPQPQALAEYWNRWVFCCFFFVRHLSLCMWRRWNGGWIRETHWRWWLQAMKKSKDSMQWCQFYCWWSKNLMSMNTRLTSLRCNL